MIIAGTELTDVVMEIYKDLSSKMKINWSCSKDKATKVFILGNHSYLINIEVENDDSPERIGLKFIHEFCHIFQFENGYQTIKHVITEDIEKVKTICNVNDFVLDVDVNERLKNNYKYYANKIYRSPKTQAYFDMLSKLQNGISDNGQKMLAVECAYIYFNDRKSDALKLLSEVSKISSKVSNYFELIYKEYEKGIITSPEFVKNKLVNICHILDFDDCYIID